MTRLVSSATGVRTWVWLGWAWALACDGVTTVQARKTLVQMCSQIVRPSRLWAWRVAARCVSRCEVDSVIQWAWGKAVGGRAACQAWSIASVSAW